MNKEKAKTIALIILGIIVIGVFIYLGYVAIYNDGFTEGYVTGGDYVVNYQTLNSKLFYYNQTGSLREIPFADLCGVVK